VRRICTNEGEFNDYESLFERGYESVDEIESAYEDAFGESFDYEDPTLAALFQDVTASIAQRDVSRVKGICDSDVFANSMTLDMVVISCFFKFAYKFGGCNQGLPRNKETEATEAFLASIEWKLEKVKYDWTVAPPPPPPQIATLWSTVVAQDPEVPVRCTQTQRRVPHTREGARCAAAGRRGDAAPDGDVVPHGALDCDHERLVQDPRVRAGGAHDARGGHARLPGHPRAEREGAGRAHDVSAVV
jgi:hypothetical protein